MKRSTLSVIAMHVTGWLLFQILPLAFLTGLNGYQGLPHILLSWQYWQFCLFYVLVFYLHGYFLLPKFFAAGKKWLYFLAMLALFAGLLMLKPFEQLMDHNRVFNGMVNRMPGPPRQGNGLRVSPMDDFHPPAGMAQGPNRSQRPPGMMRRRNSVDILSIILFIMTITLSITIDLTRRWRETVQRVTQAEADKANAELSFLKAQINPHFLFNILNNIYSMAVTSNENTADTIMKLSNIMRYVTDEVNEDYVSLQSEVDCITDYIDLQKLRLGKKVELEFAVDGDPEHMRIAPLILMTFIENVFKYGSSSHEPSKLTIRLMITPQRIDFLCQNRLFPTERKLERTGIGIANTKKRLEYLYPGKHNLQITRGHGLFTVELSLYS